MLTKINNLNFLDLIKNNYSLAFNFLNKGRRNEILLTVSSLFILMARMSPFRLSSGKKNIITYSLASLSLGTILGSNKSWEIKSLYVTLFVFSISVSIQITHYLNNKISKGAIVDEKTKSILINLVLNGKDTSSLEQQKKGIIKSLGEKCYEFTSSYYPRKAYTMRLSDIDKSLPICEQYENNIFLYLNKMLEYSSGAQQESNPQTCHFVSSYYPLREKVVILSQVVGGAPNILNHFAGYLLLDEVARNPNSPYIEFVRKSISERLGVEFKSLDNILNLSPDQLYPMVGLYVARAFGRCENELINFFPHFSTGTIFRLVIRPVIAHWIKNESNINPHQKMLQLKSSLEQYKKLNEFFDRVGFPLNLHDIEQVTLDQIRALNVNKESLDEMLKGKRFDIEMRYSDENDLYKPQKQLLDVLAAKCVIYMINNNPAYATVVCQLLWLWVKEFKQSKQWCFTVVEKTDPIVDDQGEKICISASTLPYLIIAYSSYVNSENMDLSPTESLKQIEEIASYWEKNA